MATDPRDYKLDISGIAKPRSGDAGGTAGNEAERDNRPFLAVHFACCGVYCRIYRNTDGTAYVGHCPKCAKPVRFLVGEGGTDERFFVVE